MSARGTDRRPSGFERRWRERFRRFADLHDDDAGIAGWSPSGLSARFRFFEARFGDRRPSGRWLDVGCGAGTYTRWLAGEGAETIGVDYSAASVARARDRGPATAAWLVSDAYRLPLPDGAADGVLCFGVTQAVSDTEGLVAELARVTGPEGELWIDGLNAWCLPHALERVHRWATGRETHTRFESPWRLRRTVRRAGLHHVRLLWLPILPARLARLQGGLERRWMRWLLHAVMPLGALLSHSMVVTGRRAP